MIKLSSLRGANVFSLLLPQDNHIEKVVVCSSINESSIPQLKVEIELKTCLKKL